MKCSVIVSTAASTAGTVLLFGLSILTPASMVGAAGDVEAGKAVYAKKCKLCHGAQGEGNPGMAKALKFTIPDLGAQEIQKKSDEDLKKSIAEGIGNMKPVKDLSPSDLANLIAYTRTLKKK